MADFILYGKEVCHLCEEAHQLLNEHHIHFKLADIMDKPEWQERYGVLIPVLVNIETLRQLNWPFSAHEALALA